MSWINDIAGRAEDFLNKIDHGAATVLNKEKKKKKNRINQIIIDNIASEQSVLKAKYSPPLTKKLPLPSTVTLDDRNVLSKSINDDESILHYLNNSEIDIDSLKKISDDKEPSLDPTETPQLNIVVENNIPEFTNQSRNDENQLLRNEVRSLNSEVSLLLARTKSSERELALVKSLLAKKDSDSIVLEKEILSLKQRLNTIESENAELYEENLNLKQHCKSENDEKRELSMESKLSELELEAQRKEEALKADIASLRIRINDLEESLLKERSESAKELSEVNGRLAEARKELADYRAKAQWTLAEKDKLINALRNEENESDSSNLHSLELNQLREERGKLIEELEEVRNKLETSRQHELEAERRLEAVREEATATLRSAQGRLAEETARRLAAEEHSTSHAEELHSVREELWRQVGSLNSRLKERERELTRLRRQLSERVVTRPEPELTAALVQKQEAIEVLTMEISQLRLQLERVKMSYVQDCRGVNVNDTDDDIWLTQDAFLIAGSTPCILQAYLEKLTSADNEKLVSSNYSCIYKSVTISKSNHFSIDLPFCVYKVITQIKTSSNFHLKFVFNNITYGIDPRKKCTLCEWDALEDIFHLFCFCPKYNSIRTLHFPQFRSSSHTQVTHCFLQILSSPNRTVCLSLYNFLFKILKLRSSLMD